MSKATPPSFNGKPQASRLLWWGLIVAIVILFVFLGFPGSRQFVRDIEHQEDVVELFGGQEAMEIIQHPDRVTVQRVELLDQAEMPEPKYEAFHIANYRPSGEPIVLSEAESDQLANLITAGSSYYWRPDPEPGTVESTACEVLYGLKVEYVRGDRRVSIWFCFGCNLLLIVVDDDLNPTDPAIGFFYPIRDELADIMQALFPDDEAIQSL